MSKAIEFFEINNWRKDILSSEFEQSYFNDIVKFLIKEKEDWNVVYPEKSDIFSAFNITSFDDVRVVILWQDPYHWKEQANGLCFSVSEWTRQPPSLRNIFKELESDLWILCPPKDFGDLSPWAKQWVFLLNATLTVRKDSPNSHKDAGWQQFTDAVIKKLSDKKSDLIFVLWWAYAQWKEELIDDKKHTILKSTHPSPFSAYRWFLWSKPFSRINEILKKQWQDIIDWKL